MASFFRASVFSPVKWGYKFSLACALTPGGALVYVVGGRECKDSRSEKVLSPEIGGPEQVVGWRWPLLLLLLLSFTFYPKAYFGLGRSQGFLQAQFLFKSCFPPPVRGSAYCLQALQGYSHLPLPGAFLSPICPQTVLLPPPVLLTFTEHL